MKILNGPSVSKMRMMMFLERSSSTKRHGVSRAHPRGGEMLTVLVIRERRALMKGSLDLLPVGGGLKGHPGLILESQASVLTSIRAYIRANQKKSYMEDPALIFF